MNKSILLANKIGESQVYSPEELMGLRKNSWLGWHCAAGCEHLHITPDGSVKAAACGIIENLGNVYEGDFKPAEKFIKCTIKWCMCGSDMRLKKVKNISEIELAEESTLGKKVLKQPEDAEWVKSPFVDFTNRFPLTVEWDITKRCNYSCSYCHPTISNKFDKLKSREEFYGAIFKILKKFGKGRRISWVFAGGEPTLHGDYLEIVKMLYKKQHAIHTQTNGSRLPSYFAELIQFSSIGISVHLEFAKPQKIVEIAKAIQHQKSLNSSAKQHWFGVRIMVPPGRFEEGEKLFKAMEEIDAVSSGTTVYMSTVYDREIRNQLMDYTPVEFEKIMSFS